MPDLLAREIFAAGTHNGERYTEKDLDDMVEAFASLDFAPALKQGHVADETGLPALGYVANLRRVGSKLVADFVDLPQEIFDAISAKRFSRVSAEIFHNFKRAGQTFRRVLKAVALLGVEIPAVHGLKPLHEFASEDFESIKTVEFEIKEVKKMADDKTQEQIAELTKKFAALADENAKLKADKADADEKAKVFAAEVAALKEQATKSQVDAKLAGLKVPALRDHFASLYKMGLGQSKLLKFKDGEKAAETVIDEMLAEINKAAESLFTEQAAGGKQKESGDPSQDFDAAVKAYQADKRCSYKDAMTAVRAQKPELFKAYATGSAA